MSCGGLLWLRWLWFGQEWRGGSSRLGTRRVKSQMTLARRAGTVIVLETGVYFPMLDLDRPRAARVVCFHTRAGFRWMQTKGM